MFRKKGHYKQPYKIIAFAVRMTKSFDEEEAEDGKSGPPQIPPQLIQIFVMLYRVIIKGYDIAQISSPQYDSHMVDEHTYASDYLKCAPRQIFSIERQ